MWTSAPLAGPAPPTLGQTERRSRKSRDGLIGHRRKPFGTPNREERPRESCSRGAALQGRKRRLRAINCMVKLWSQGMARSHACANNDEPHTPSDGPAPAPHRPHGASKGGACRRFRLRSPLGRIEVLQSSCRRCPGLAFVSMNAIAPVGRCRVRIMRQKTNDVDIPTSTTTLEVRPGKSSGSRTRTKRRANLTSNPALFIRGSFRFP